MIDGCLRADLAVLCCSAPVGPGGGPAGAIGGTASVRHVACRPGAAGVACRMRPAGSARLVRACEQQGGGLCVSVSWAWIPRALRACPEGRARLGLPAWAG